MVACNCIAESVPDRSQDERRLIVAFRALRPESRAAVLRDVELRSFNFSQPERDDE